MFGFIENIVVKEPNTWQDNIFITFDIDWAIDEVLLYTLELVERTNIKATFFITHKTAIIEKLKTNPNIKLGIHPNFNPLLNGDYCYGSNIKEVLKYYKNIVPEAKVIRSHSLTTSSTILNEFADQGFTHECNLFVPHTSNINLKPYRHWYGNLIRVPHFWEDDVHLEYKNKWDVGKIIYYKGIKVFDFHPIHLFINTKSIVHYCHTRKNLKNYLVLKNVINDEQVGVRDLFLELIKELKNI